MPKDALDGLSEAKLAKMQQKLDELCQEHGIPMLDIKASKKSRGWRDLVLNEFLKVPSRQQRTGPQHHSDDHIHRIGCRIEALLDFCPFDSGGIQAIADPLKIEEAIKTVILEEGGDPKADRSKYRHIWERYNNAKKKYGKSLGASFHDDDCY